MRAVELKHGTRSWYRAHLRHLSYFLATKKTKQTNKKQPTLGLKRVYSLNNVYLFYTAIAIRYIVVTYPIAFIRSEARLDRFRSRARLHRK